MTKGYDIFWRSLEQREGNAVDEPAAAATPDSWVDAPVGRRRFLQLLGGTVAIESIAACTRQPPEKIIPYVKAPEDVLPGRPLFYATALPIAAVVEPVLVETHMGRPTKVEGNPDHPMSRGATSAFAQAEVLELYDPDRSQAVLHNAEVSSWASFASAIQVATLGQRSVKGRGLRIVTGDTTSPTLIAQLRALLSEMPDARWHIHDPSRAQPTTGTAEPMQLGYRFDRADVILSLDADFLGGPGPVGAIGDFAARRRPPPGQSKVAKMSRLYAAHSAPTLTASMADHRAGMRSAEIEHLARLIAAKLIDLPANEAIADGAVMPSTVEQRWIDAVAADLRAAGRHALVIAGTEQPPVVHRLAHAMNAHLGGAGHTVVYRKPIRASQTQPAGTLAELTADLNAGKVQLLVILGSNPVYSSPADLKFTEALRKAPLRVHLGRYVDETGELCHWHVPQTHSFEAWSDGRSHDGTVSLIQPLIEPLFAGKSAHELLGAMSNQPDRSGYDIVRAHHQAQLDGSPFELRWRRILHDGFVRGSEHPPLTPPPLQQQPWPAAKPVPTTGLELVFRNDPTVLDGRYANNAWLQELPKPLSKLTWDNALWLSHTDATERGLTNGQIVQISVGERKLEAAVWIMPGQPAGSLTLHLGYGRRGGGQVAAGRGFDAYQLRTTKHLHVQHGVELRPTNKTVALASAQMHGSMEGRDLVRSGCASAYQNDPQLFTRHEHKRLSLYPPHEYSGYSWGMTIDLSSCVGCSACVVACQSENNIPVVGKDEVLVGREMHWIRIDRYFGGEPDEPETLFQPVPCMHCDNAPCEVVCPVQATTHHDEGLNDMVYNRCVGTKYCSNNCPYKVRRYNFFGYSVEAIAPLDPTQPSMRLLHNPDVTVRTYGVMEKCTYCVQRINYGRVDAKRDNRRIRDGDVMTACQAACPAQAISFGDLNDPQSEVSQRKSEPRNYGILAELNTEPRTTYLARLTNPNEDLAPDDCDDQGGHGHG